MMSKYMLVSNKKLFNKIGITEEKFTKEKIKEKLLKKVLVS